MRWLELICPYKHELVSFVKGYFSAKIESIPKDVECVFGILKKRWRILDYGIRFRNIHVVQKVLVVCCMLYNNMLSEVETTDSDAHVGCGGPIDGDGLWLRGDNREFGVEDNRLLEMLWGQQ